MTNSDLNDLSLTELKKLQRDIARAIESFDKRQKQTVLSALEEKAREYGFALVDLFSNIVGKSAKGAKAAPRYANAADPSIAWSGRSRQPGWFKDAVAAGNDPKSMEI